MFFDPMYFVFALPPMIFGLWAQFKVKSAFSKYAGVANSTGYTGAQIARRLLDSQGLYEVAIESVPGELTDHYDPRSKVIRLSDSTMYRNSVAAIGVVAHEVGHAIQDAQSYAPMRTRAAILPVANIGSMLGPYIFMLGIFINMFGLAFLGLLLFGSAALFQAVTLPVEYNASNRAMRLLVDNGLVTSYDAGMARQVLDAAALTYVAALLQSVSQVLYYAMVLSGTRRRED